MKKNLKYFLCLATLSFGKGGAEAYAQNLIPNYSFEDTLQCPYLVGQINFTPLWTNPTNANTSTLYNSCNNGLVGVPNNIEGHQYARTGDAYAGIATFTNNDINWRDYLQVKLISKLAVNKKYCVEFYVSLADTQVVAANNIGMYFSDTAITGTPNQALIVIPQISNDIILNPLTDKTGWTKVSGSFIANGIENYITIGNFLNDANTDTTLLMVGVLTASYYYIDDVSVQCCDCDTSQPASMSISNIFTPNNDGINDVFKITTKNITTLNCKIYNRWGILVGELKNANDIWDGRTTAGLECSEGVYYYVLTATADDGKEHEEKGFAQLVR